MKMREIRVREGDGKGHEDIQRPPQSSFRRYDFIYVKRYEELMCGKDLRGALTARSESKKKE